VTDELCYRNGAQHTTRKSNRQAAMKRPLGFWKP
jgi:hypothetical protein